MDINWKDDLPEKTPEEQAQEKFEPIDWGSNIEEEKSLPQKQKEKTNSYYKTQKGKEELLQIQLEENKARGWKTGQGGLPMIGPPAGTIIRPPSDGKNRGASGSWVDSSGSPTGGASGGWEDSEEVGHARRSVIKNMFKNFLPSLGRELKSMAQPFLHPLETQESLSNLIADAALSVTGVEAETPTIDAIKDMYRRRYTTKDGFLETLENDPVAFLSDLSIFLGGSGAAIQGAGKLTGLMSKLKNVPGVGNFNIIKKIGDVTGDTSKIAIKTGNVLKDYGTRAEALRLVGKSTNWAVKPLLNFVPEEFVQFFSDAATNWNKKFTQTYHRPEQLKIGGKILDSKIKPDVKSIERGRKAIRETLQPLLRERLREAKLNNKQVSFEKMMEPVLDLYFNKDKYLEADVPHQFMDDIKSVIDEQVTSFAHRFDKGNNVIPVKLEDVTYKDSSGKLKFRTKPETARFFATRPSGRIEIIERELPYIREDLSTIQAQLKKMNVEGKSSFRIKGESVPKSEISAGSKEAMHALSEGLRNQLIEIEEVGDIYDKIHKIRTADNMLYKHSQSLMRPNIRGGLIPFAIDFAIKDKMLLSELAIQMNELRKQGVGISPNLALIRLGLIKLNDLNEYQRGDGPSLEQKKINELTNYLKQKKEDAIQQTKKFVGESVKSVGY